MLARKAFIKIFADKPERFGQIAGTVINPGTIEELRQIPELGLCEVAAFSDLVPLCDLLRARRPKAIVPTICYRGTEYGQWECTGESIVRFRRFAERELGIFVCEPVILGSPAFWWAINGRFAHALRERFGFYSPCCGCRVYSLALQVPLCRALGARFIAANAACRWDCTAAAHASDLAQRYYRSLMSSFGVDLWQVGSPAVKKDHDLATDKEIYQISNISKMDCIFNNNSSYRAGPDKAFNGLARYFEFFAIPAAAKIISKALGGHEPDYQQEAADTLYPAGTARPKKTKRRH